MMSPDITIECHDIQCSIAYSHLEVIDEILKKREEILDKYKSNLENFKNSFQMEKENIRTVNWVTTFFSYLMN